jgi:curved DNA-binding protein CbpA
MEDDNPVDPFLLLGVTRDCTDFDVTRAYRAAALRLHPDKNPSAEAAAQFQAVKLASETLLDPALRAAAARAADARALTSARRSKMTAERARLREELEARERASGAARAAEAGAAAAAGDVLRLRREGQDVVERFMAARVAVAVAPPPARVVAGVVGTAPGAGAPQHAPHGESPAAKRARFEAPSEQAAAQLLVREGDLLGRMRALGVVQTHA